MKRKQLTLFLEETESQIIESVRQRFNPVQYSLIKSHITLCREDEIEQFDLIQRNLEQLRTEAFTLTAAKPKRFSEEKGVFIPIRDDQGLFKQLREAVLKNVIQNPRAHEPHITLMHPRNSTCTDMIFHEIQQIEMPQTLSISKISVIEQEMGKVWHTLDVYELKN